MWLLNRAGQLELQFFDFDASKQTELHATRVWTKGATHDGPRNGSSIAAIHVNGTDSNTRFVHYIDNDNNVQQLETVGEAENLTFSTPMLVDKAIDRKVKLSAVVVETGKAAGREIHVIFQKVAGVFTDFIRTLDSNNWSMKDIPVHD